MEQSQQITASSGRRRTRRLLALAVLGIVAVAAALAYGHFWLHRPAGSGPAGPAVPREPFERTWSTRKVLLLGVGDSITAGFGVDKDHSYFALLEKNPEDEFPEMQGRCLRAVLPDLQVRNLAMSGSTSLEHLEILRGRLPRQEPDTLGIVVMTIGGNDLIHSYGRMPPREGAMYGATWEQARPWIESFEKRLGAMLDLLEDRFPGGCHIFLGDIYDPTDGVGDAPAAGLPPWPDGVRILQAYNDILRRAADRPSVRLVPIHDTFLGHGIHCTQFWREHYHGDDPTYWYGSNLEDPNARGYDALRRIFLLEMLRSPVSGEKR